MSVHVSPLPALASYLPPNGVASGGATLASVAAPSRSTTTPGIAEIALDSVSLQGTQHARTLPTLNKGEMLARYSSDFAVHLGMSDVPAALSIAANLTPLPPTFAPILQVCNAANTFTGLAAIATDLREIHGSLRNPRATNLDRVVDLGHLVLGDVVSTAASAIPLVAPLSNPWALGLFVGGQVLGIATDIAKTAYDIHRKGQQSA
jgi:hypothetical protein